jgi:diacylglycerol kinase family enzyme
MACIALLSNPNSTGNRAMLPRVRGYCAQNDAVFHYEVDHIDQIDAALRTIAQVRPKVIVINGGDGTVQAALTKLHHHDYFAGHVPPVAVLPNGKTNLIALDLNSVGDPLRMLDRILQIARTDLEAHIVQRQLISLTQGNDVGHEVLGMFLGGAGLSESILYCRHKIYPLGLPNTLSHILTLIASLMAMIFGLRTRFLPKLPEPIRISVMREGQLQGRFALLIVTTLERLLIMGSNYHSGSNSGRMKFLAIESNVGAAMRFVWSVVRGRLGSDGARGVHLNSGQVIQIDGDNSKLVMDGEMFTARDGEPIVLRATKPVDFLRLAA